MSGILEDILNELKLIRAAVSAAAPQAQAGSGQTQAQPAAVQQQYVQPVAAFDPMTGQPIQAVQQQPAPPANLTADQITALIQPHIGNEAIKTELGNAMRSMGINALPETQPHQYGQLYTLFQNVIARFTGGHGNSPATPAAPPASII